MDVHKLWIGSPKLHHQLPFGPRDGHGDHRHRPSGSRPELAHLALIEMSQPLGVGSDILERQDLPLEHDEVGIREMAETGFGAFLEATTDAASTTALGPPRRPRRGCATTSWTSDSACLMPSLRHTVWVFAWLLVLQHLLAHLCRHYRLASRHG